jgi:TonB family protein
MNQETTTPEFRIQFLHGWLVSCLVHGLLLFSLLPIFRQSLIIPQKPFHWNVALVQSTEVAHKPAQPTDNSEPTVSRRPTHVSPPARASRPIHKEASHTTRVTSPEPPADTSIAPEFKPDIPSSVTSPAESTLASTIEEPRPNLPPATNPLPQQTESQTSATTQEPSLQETVEAAAQGSTVTTESAQPSPPPATTPDNIAASAIQPNYDWLQLAIFRRLEELKRLSHPRLDQPQPLKVLVRAVVSHEGALLNAEVVKSSGLDRIDQEAMALVQRAFPMQLDRTLDRRQIAMRIPITYSRE